MQVKKKSWSHTEYKNILFMFVVFAHEIFFFKLSSCSHTNSTGRKKCNNDFFNECQIKNQDE